MWQIGNAIRQTLITLDPLKTVKSINQGLQEHTSAWGKKSEVSFSAVKPYLNKQMFCFDAVVLLQGSWIGVVWISSKGQIIKAWSTRSNASTPEEAEDQVNLEAFQCVISIGIKHLLLQGNAKNTMEELLKADAPQTNKHWSTISKALVLLFFFDSWTVHFVPRNTNFLIHNVDHWAAANNFVGSIPLSSLPSNAL